MNRYQIERDLLWAINSSTLLTTSPAFTPIDKNVFDLERLVGHVVTTSDHRVGRYFERLIGFWLSEVRGLTDCQHSTQIRDGNRTVGELDFLFTDEQGRRTHLETAVKFYLYDPQSVVGGSHFIGPNAGDTFERKTKRLLKHQLPLGRKHFQDVTVTGAWVKGRIFYHPLQAMPSVLPAELSTQHLRGTWIRASELGYFREQEAASVYRVLLKPYWLSEEVASFDDPKVLSTDDVTKQLTQHFLDSAHPVLLSRLNRREHQLGEVERIFVVADCWPG
ncbi:MAG: DUF1853 family protein [Pirellulaceae bacterium]